MNRDPVSHISHKLRTPIAVVQGFADLLSRDDGRLTQEQRAEYAQRIIGAAGEMREILDEAGAAQRAREPSEDRAATDAA